MKSAIEWFDQLKVPFDGDVTIRDFILIQDDARADLLAHIKSLEYQNAKLREAVKVADEVLRYIRLREHYGPVDEHGSHYTGLCAFCSNVDKALNAINALEL